MLLLLATWSMLAIAPSWSADDGPAPDALVRKITTEVLEAINQDEALRSGDKTRALALAEQKVLPYIDFRRMTMLAVGKSWRKANEAQQQTLVREFRNLLLRTYSATLKAYRGQTLEVSPLRPGQEENDVTVKSRYLSPGQAPIPVEYQMRRTAAGWRVYDVVADGISLVALFRSAFADELERGGIEGLIETLQTKRGSEDASTETSRSGER
jgi:phospholipid transport system substrate-binding protein